MAHLDPDKMFAVIQKLPKCEHEGCKNIALQSQDEYDCSTFLCDFHAEERKLYFKEKYADGYADTIGDLEYANELRELFGTPEEPTTIHDNTPII